LNDTPVITSVIGAAVTYQQFIEWLDATPLSLLLKVTTWVIPSVQSIHILGIGVVLSGAVIISLRLAGLRGSHLPVATLVDKVIPPIWWAILVLLLSGLILIIAEPTRTLNNPFFFTKMGCLLLLVPLTRYFQLAVRRNPLRWGEVSVPSRAIRPAVAGAMLLLLVVIFCGRWIAYA
jgi:hypothetical protein